MWRRSALSLLALTVFTASGLAAQRAASGRSVAGAGGAKQAKASGAPNARDSALSQRLKAAPQDSFGRLVAPVAAGRPAEPVTARDNSELVKALERKIRCTCGCNLDVFTCRTTDFTCTTSPAMHRLVLARLDSGMTEAQVLDAFQKQYGEMIFMQPPKRGFNWAAYVMPFVGLAFGLGLVVGVVKRWARVARATTEPAAAAAAPAAAGVATPEELERLKRELEQFEA